MTLVKFLRTPQGQDQFETVLDILASLSEWGMDVLCFLDLIFFHFCS